MACKNLVLVLLVVSCLKADDDLRDFEFSDSDDEVMIAQESRHYQTFVKPPVRIVKPTGVTNSHRPQYNLDSFEDDVALEELEELFETTTKKAYKPAYKIRSKESMIKEAVLRALERKDHVGKFAQILPIIRAMSGSQRTALASLVASQVTTPPGRAPLNLAQVRSMFGNNANTTTDLMLPILLDMANLIRRADRSGKQSREVRISMPPAAQLLRRSFTEDTHTDEEDTTVTEKAKSTPNTIIKRSRRIVPRTQAKDIAHDHNRTVANDTKLNNTETANNKTDEKNVTKSSTTEAPTIRGRSVGSKITSDNSTLDLTADSTNQTLAQDLPVAEKLRSLNRYVDRKGNLIRRGTYPPKPSLARRTTAEPTLNPISRRRPAPPRKLPNPADQAKCELFTNTLCLHAEDYPTEAIVQSIRRNKAAAGALLADFRDPGDGAVDGVTAAQEAKYTAEHYLVSNRRGDTANRDFASAGEAGFMCPSTVKYARPQRARATSGQWKYIVNTGEHTQTLRLEKCLKPKESCTYLTDNFKSKCVQVYNYHRLLTWDQQNGLHMDIFKVPTCCSCHIEGYSVSFPPVGHRVHETSAENVPEDLSSEHGNHAFESVQSSIHRPSVSKSPPFTHGKPLETFPPFSDTHNLISGVSFSNSKLNDNEDNGSIPPSSPMDSYGNTYFPDSFNQASSVRNIKRPLSARSPAASNNFETITLPSYLEPPTPSGPGSYTFLKETPNKYKITGSQFKRGPVRPSRRPIRKKISGPDDLLSSGTSAVESFTDSHLETMEDFNEESEEPDVGQATVNVNHPPPKRVTIAPKLQSVTTELISTTFRPQDQTNVINEHFTSNGKRVNYNYHPIIDFFGEDEKEIDNESIDREDNEGSYISPVQSEWKPINNPPPRNVQTANLAGRKKQIMDTVSYY
ncbi:neurotrophin 1 isoform X2 [Ostrinia furnacalis]|uniref:neurotrophin 1 isoform X2 n=1 Tax=Ostrinia furnacalis TaxID=93504 RepID=UPI001039E367|nr:neurotrophin 1 isoform X2 [Ostrinia furnacalis]